MNGEQPARGAWGSRFGFIMAAAGSAVGLGNIWKFPYITGENGGGLFVLIYLACIGLVGIPIMAAEIMIGRAARRQPVGAFRVLQGGPTPWSSVGWLGVIAGFVILSYYIVVAGWAMDYTLKSVVNFGEPMREEAEKEATRYRAATPIEDMRARMVALRTKRESREEVEEARRQVPGSYHRAFESFSQALQAAGGTAAARSALLEDEELQTRVTAVEEVNRQAEQALTRARNEALAHYAAMSSRDLREEASVEERRSQILARVQAAFGALYQDGWTSLFWSALFMLATILVVARGIHGGIERWCTLLMPLLLVLILFMVGYGMLQRGFGEALSFVFKPSAHRLQASGVLEALGHAFFTLSLGMGGLITYGSYQRTKENLLSQSVTIAGLDTLIALLACLMMFPIIFTYGGEPGAGPGLVFISMPVAFAEIGAGGMLLSILFFGLLVFAALTSSISLLEVVASYFIDERGWSRSRAAWTLGTLILAFGSLSAFAADPAFALQSWEPGYGKNFFDTMDYLVSNWMLPLGGLLISVYAGWFLRRRVIQEEMEGVGPLLVTGWLLLIRFVAPLLVIVVLLQKVGILDADEFFYNILK